MAAQDRLCCRVDKCSTLEVGAGRLGSGGTSLLGVTILVGIALSARLAEPKIDEGLWEQRSHQWAFLPLAAWLFRFSSMDGILFAVLLIFGRASAISQVLYGGCLLVESSQTVRDDLTKWQYG